MKAEVVKLSICPCGFPVLNDDIPIGTEYDIDPVQADCTFICGGCGRWHRVKGVMAKARLLGQRAGFLPLDIFKEEQVRAE